MVLLSKLSKIRSAIARKDSVSVFMNKENLHISRLDCFRKIMNYETEILVN